MLVRTDVRTESRRLHTWFEDVQTAAQSRGGAFNIHELDAGAREHCTWCFAPDGVATGDVNLAQKIALQNFENRALSVANRSSAFTSHWGQGPSEPRSWMRWS
jgi:hypothetical protein